MSELEPMACASCGGPLMARSGGHGIVWVCGSCTAGATTLGVLRRVAPSQFINHLWQAARHTAVPSPKSCPSCTQPLLEFRGPGVEVEPRMEVCCRCFLVWMEKTSLLALGIPAGRDRSAALQARAEADAMRESRALDHEVRRAIAEGVAGALVAALPAKTGT